MPVPTVMSITCRRPRAAPNVTSAQAAALASFSTITGTPTRSSTCFFTGSSRQARLGANTTVELASSTNPAAPTPTASISWRPSKASTASPMTVAVASGLAAGVDSFSFSTMRPCWSTTPAATLVPPTSTPIVRLTVRPFTRTLLLSRLRPRRACGARARGPPFPGRTRASRQHRVEGGQRFLDGRGHRVAGPGQLRAETGPGFPDPAGATADGTPGALRRIQGFIGRCLGCGGPPDVSWLLPAAAQGPADLLAELAAHAPGTRPDEPALHFPSQVRTQLARLRGLPGCGLPGCGLPGC